MTGAIPAWWQAKNGWDFWSDYNEGVWEPDTHAFIDEYVTAGSTYVDLGAWIGPTVLWAAPHAGRVVAVEPDPEARRCFVENTEGFTNVELVAAAIGPESGTEKLCPHTEGFGSSMSRLVRGVVQSGIWDTGAACDVTTWTLPDLFVEYAIENVSLVKMDIEGGEADVLESVCPFLAGLGIPFVVSLHPDWVSQPIRAEWFDCFSKVLGDLTGPAPVLCLP